MTYSAVAVTDLGTCIHATSCAIDMQLLVERSVIASCFMLFCSQARLCNEAYLT